MYDKDIVLGAINLQCDVNDMLDPNWMSERRPYLLAAVSEIGELASSTGSMWWIKNELDNNILLECADILAFVLSHEIRATSSIEGVAEKMVNSILDNRILERESGPSLSTLIVELAENISDFCSVISKLQHILYIVGYSMDDLLTVHKHKSMLNMHRFKNGYADGTYTKVINGVEDNEALLRIIKNASDKSDYESHLKKLAELGYTNNNTHFGT